MKNNFVTRRFLPALTGLLLGTVSSGATLSYYRGNALDYIIVGGLFYGIGFLVATMLIAAIVWGLGYITIGSIHRRQFQAIWIVIAAILQVLIAVLSTYDLFQLEILSKLFAEGSAYPKIVTLAFPYLMTFGSIATFLNDETEASRQQRLEALKVIESEFRYERAKSRTTAGLPIVVFTLLGGVFGWIFPLEPGAALITSILGASVGIPIGMVIHRYSPRQRRLRELE